MLACGSRLCKHTFLLAIMRQQLSLWILCLGSWQVGLKSGVLVRGLLAPT